MAVVCAPLLCFVLKLISNRLNVIITHTAPRHLIVCRFEGLVYSVTQSQIYERNRICPGSFMTMKIDVLRPKIFI